MDKTFNEQCYEALMKVPSGKVTTYKDLANALGTRAYRAVGNAMNKNPHNTKKVPCHRVINSNGDVGGYAWQPELKRQKLKEEGITIKDDKIDLKKYRYSFF